MKRILVVILSEYGGAERIQLQIVEMLKNTGWNVKICRISFPNSTDNIEELYPVGVEKDVIKYSFQLQFLLKLYKEIRHYQPDIVFASAIHINLRLLALAKLFPKIKFVMRNENYLYTISSFKRVLIKYLYNSADKVISQTKEMETELVKNGVKPNKITTLHNPINEREILEKATENNPYNEENKIRFVAVGRFAYQKGFDILIKAFSGVISEIANAELYIIGDIEYGNRVVYNQLNKLIDIYKLNGKVFFPGFKKNPYPYILNANVFVLSSRYEGLPNALIEAQFLGKPSAAVLCIPIISEIVNNGENGYTAIPEDSDSLCDAMLKCVNLSQINMCYQPNKKADFIKVFEDLLL